MATKKRKTVRQTGDGVSSSAGRVLAAFKRARFTPHQLDMITIVGATLRELRTMAASLVNQDEHRGPRGTRRK